MSYKQQRLANIERLLDKLDNKTAPTDKIARVLKLVEAEMRDADEHFKPFNSAHEGYGVILEEMDELWDEIKKNQKTRDYRLMVKEAIQLSAMAARLITDVCMAPNPGHEMLTDRQCVFCGKSGGALMLNASDHWMHEKDCP